MKDPYALLGLTRDADPDLIRSKYQELHALYSEQRFKPGEEGNEGARKLQELEEAWAQIESDLDRDSKTAFASAPDYGEIDRLIRDGKYNEAQDLLDAISDRGGEWHYMQSIVFYKRDWLTESRTQLEMALQDDPGNAKYRSSLDKLNMAINAPKAPQFNQYGNGQYGGPQPQYDQQPSSGDSMANCLSTCCCAYCLTDCLCSMLRCI